MDYGADGKLEGLERGNGRQSVLFTCCFVADVRGLGCLLFRYRKLLELGASGIPSSIVAVIVVLNFFLDPIGKRGTDDSPLVSARCPSGK